MADSERKLLEERLAAIAQQTLEELKREGVAEDEMEPAGMGAYPAWLCMVSYKRASSDDSFLVIRFPLEAGEDVEQVAKREIKGQFQNEDNWEFG